MAEVLELNGILEQWVKPYLYFKCPNCSSIIRQDANSADMVFCDGRVMGVHILCPRCLEDIVQKPCTNLNEIRDSTWGSPINLERE